MKKMTLGLNGVAAAVLMALSVNVQAIEPSNVSDNGNDGHSAANVIDNKLSTRWSDEGTDGSERLQFEFSEQTTITAVNIAFYQGSSRRYSFEIQSSENGSDWQPDERSIFMKKEFTLTDGTIWKPERVERPFVLTNEKGQPIMLYVAVADKNVNGNIAIPIKVK